MGEAKRRKDLGLKSKKGPQNKVVNSSPRLIKWHHIAAQSVWAQPIGRL